MDNWITIRAALWEFMNRESGLFPIYLLDSVSLYLAREEVGNLLNRPPATMKKERIEFIQQKRKKTKNLLLSVRIERYVQTTEFLSLLRTTYNVISV